jgi:hypothetical protein
MSIRSWFFTMVSDYGPSSRRFTVRKKLFAQICSLNLTAARPLIRILPSLSIEKA